MSVLPYPIQRRISGEQLAKTLTYSSPTRAAFWLDAIKKGDRCNTYRTHISITLVDISRGWAGIVVKDLAEVDVVEQTRLRPKIHPRQDDHLARPNAALTSHPGLVKLLIHFTQQPRICSAASEYQVSIECQPQGRSYSAANPSRFSVMSS